MRRSCFIWICVLVFLSSPLYPAAIKDAESASHVDTAATYQIVETYTFPGFDLVQINLAVLSHYSYLLISDGKALIVDPGRDIDQYLELIKKQSLSVVGVFLTHSHADFVAGHMELVKALNCPIYQSAKSGAQYTIEPIEEGTILQVGKARVKFLDTPGHVLDGTSALVYSPGSDKPELMLTGDYLFVGGIGRPDLVTGTTSSALAGMFFDTWQSKVSKLPDSVRIYPAHGAGSLCGAHLKDDPFSTIGQERTSNPNLQHSGRAEFITVVLSELQEPPQYFKFNAAMNRQGPDLVNWNAEPKVSAAEAGSIDFAKSYVVDLRSSREYAAGHIPNSVNIGLRGRLETWVGIMVPWDSSVILCGGPVDDLKEAVHRLHRVGYSVTILPFADWQKPNLPITKSNLVDPKELFNQMPSAQGPVVIDVRLPNEWMGLRIGTVLNLPLNHLAELSKKLDPSQSVVAVCNSAYRSSMAMGILERNGFKQISSLNGGSEAWINAGLPVFGAETQASPKAHARKAIPLPERICANELKRLMVDLPGTYDIVDIRPAEMFADYSLPGSENVDIAELIANPAYLVGIGPLIIVDRDGTLAMAVGGILSQKTPRQIKALYGGLEAWWNLTELPSATVSPSIPAALEPKTMAPARTMPVTPQPTSPASPAPQPPKRKSAGC